MRQPAEHGHDERLAGGPAADTRHRHKRQVVVGSEQGMEEPDDGGGSQESGMIHNGNRSIAVKLGSR